MVDDLFAATFCFRDEPRVEGASFVKHLRPKLLFDRVMIVSGDRESEVRYLAERVGIKVVHAGQTPEQKLEIVRGSAAPGGLVASYLGTEVLVKAAATDSHRLCKKSHRLRSSSALSSFFTWC